MYTFVSVREGWNRAYFLLLMLRNVLRYILEYIYILQKAKTRTSFVCVF